MQQAFEPMQPLQDTDVDGYLRNEHELLIVGVIEEERRQVGLEGFMEIWILWKYENMEIWIMSKWIQMDDLGPARISIAV